MRFKDLSVGKYVTLNRWLRHYYNAYSEILEIVSVPDTKEDGKVGCRQVTKYGSIMEKDKYCNYVIKDEKAQEETDKYYCLSTHAIQDSNDLIQMLTELINNYSNKML